MTTEALDALRAEYEALPQWEHWDGAWWIRMPPNGPWMLSDTVQPQHLNNNLIFYFAGSFNLDLIVNIDLNFNLNFNLHLNFNPNLINFHCDLNFDFNLNVTLNFNLNLNLDCKLKLHLIIKCHLN